MSASALQWVVEVSEADFESQVLRASFEKLVVVDFWAPWCQPCRMLAPILEKVIGEHKDDIALAKVNTDEEQSLAGRYRIEALPTVLVFRNGQIVFQFQGLVLEEQLRELLGRLLPTAAEQLAQQAARLEATEPAQAEPLYRKALEQDNHLEIAWVGLARTLTKLEREEEALQALEKVLAGGDLAEEVEKLRSVLVTKQRAREAGDEAAVRQALQADPNNAQAHFNLAALLAAKGEYQPALEELLAAGERDHKLLTSKVREMMVQIFHVIGDQSPLANQYRRLLSSLLY